MSKLEDIEEQAIRLFSERGVHAVSMRDIAVAAGTSPANIYAHFSGKEALVERIFRSGFEEYAGRISEACTGPGSVRARLEEMVRAVLLLHDRDTARFRFLLLRQHDHLGAVERDARNPVEVIKRFVEDAMEQGEIPRRDPDLMALVVVGIVVQPATGHLYGRLDGDLARHAAPIAEACMRALS